MKGQETMEKMKEVISLIESQKQELAKKILHIHCARSGHNYDDMPERYRDKYLQDTMYNLNFLAASLKFGNRTLFANYMGWLAKLMKGLGINLNEMLEHFRSLQIILQKEITSEEIKKEISEYLDQGIDVFEKTYLGERDFEDVVYSAEVEEFTDVILNFKRDKAASYVMEKVESGEDIKKIYTELLQPTLIRIGDLWHGQKISVAKEHYATSVIQNIIGLLYPYLFKDHNSNGKVFVGACGGSELHEIGLRMVADFFEMEGWDTYYLGSNLPVEYILDEVREKKPDVLGISTTTIVNLEYTQKLIEFLKQEPLLQDIKIIVGGKIYNEDPELYKMVGADAFARDADEAIKVAGLLMGESDG